MHFEMLVEDLSGKIAIDELMEKILGPSRAKHSWRLHPYKGIGHIPKDLRRRTDPKKRLLLSQLPRLLRGYGRSLNDSSAVVVIVDSDRRDCMVFKRELVAVLNACDPRPNALFRIAVEESEAWLLGDRAAVKAAYPRAKDSVLERYRQDAICGTWEVLADAIHSGGSAALAKVGYPASGTAKCEWARAIAPHMDPDRNRSPSFRAFRDGVRRLAGAG